MNYPRKNFFDNYAPHYRRMSEIDRLPDDVEKLRRDRLPRWIKEIPLDARILDGGCGQGHLLAALFKLGYRDLHGVDVSSQMICGARDLLPDTVRLVESDIREFLSSAGPESFDVVFFHDILEHLPRGEIISVLDRLYQVLRPGGRLRIRVPNMGAFIAGYTACIDFTHVTHFTEWSLLQVLEASGFDPEKVTLEVQSPRLFWSWRRPHGMIFRLLNRVRWYLNNLMHRMIYLLADMRPRPTVFDPNIVAVAFK